MFLDTFRHQLLSFATATSALQLLRKSTVMGAGLISAIVNVDNLHLADFCCCVFIALMPGDWGLRNQRVGGVIDVVVLAGAAFLVSMGGSEVRVRTVLRRTMRFRR